MEASLLHKLRTAPKISSALVEDIFLCVSEPENKDKSFIEVLRLCGVKENDLEAVGQAIVSEFSEKDESGKELSDLDKRREERKARLSKNSVELGSAFIELFKEADLTKQCLFISDFDPEIALHIYESVDFRLVAAAFKLKNEFTIAQTHAQHEAVGLVFGGGGDSKRGNVTYHDASEIQGTISG